MSTFIPGNIIKTINSRKGTAVELRYPKWEDINKMTEYVNTISKEDTYISFSGEEISKESEMDFLASIFKKMEIGDGVAVSACTHDNLIGLADISRNTTDKRRGLHVAHLAISVAKEYRGEGIGKELIKTIIDEAKKKIDGIKIVDLSVFGNNSIGLELYKAIGFKEWGRLPGGFLYKGTYIDYVRMYLEL